MIPIEYKVGILNNLPSITDDGRAITRVLQSYSLNEYTNPIIGVNFLDEWDHLYESIDSNWEIVDEDSYQFSKYYTTRIRFTVAANDFEYTKVNTIEIVDGQTEYNLEPLTSIEATTSSSEFTINGTYDGVIFSTQPTEETVTITYKIISRGYVVAHSIMEDAIEWVEINLGTYLKPIDGWITDRGSLKDISELIGDNALVILSYDFVIGSKKTFMKVNESTYVPIEEITVDVEIQEE